MKINFEKVINSVEELKEFDRSDFNTVAALCIHTICNYENEELFYEMLQYLMGPMQEISPMFKSRIKDRMDQNEKYKYIGKGYFLNTKVEDGYNLVTPLEIEVFESVNQPIESGYKLVEFKHTGADSNRQLMLRLGRDNNWYLWSDSIINLLIDVRQYDAFWA